MLTFLKTLIILGIMLLLAYPFIPGPANPKLRALFVASSLKYDPPKNKRNFPFVILVLLEFLVSVLLFDAINTLMMKLSGINFINNLFSNIANAFNPQFNFILFTLLLVIVNIVFLYAYIFLKVALKKTLLDPLFKRIDRKKGDAENEKDKKTESDDKTEDSEEGDDSNNDKKEEDPPKKTKRIPKFLHRKKKKSSRLRALNLPGDDEDYEALNTPGPVACFIYGLFFFGDEYQYAKNWVIRVRKILQIFVILIEVLYVIFVLSVLTSMFFPLPMKLYDILLNVLRIHHWYIYPVISILFLQEVCNCLKALPYYEGETAKSAHDAEEEENKKLDARLRKLLSELKRRFDSEHSLRYYPEADQKEVKEYIPKSRTYHSALEYIRKQMLISSGRVVQSYMQCLDASFNDDHVYFASSFYSELGEYLVAYTYIRLLSGSRMIFIASNTDECDSLRTFISDRLMQITGTEVAHGWRVYTADERLDQADILIACPEDFRDNNIVSQYPSFFEEVSNAVFIDADRIITSNSYLCPVISTRLIKATEGQIRFIFLSQDLYKGFAAKSLPKFFCVEPILSFSSANENESVSYVLWNKESKNRRIYNKHGQKNTCLECMIADLACEYDVDGVRVITESALDHAEHKMLANRDVEINKLYRDVADVNYMIYSDERCNLSAAIYVCTRFRGRKKSMVHIISKPYLLREYFISKASLENFVNRSSFIQPRVTEHAENHKLSLLRLFCDVSSENGLPLAEFESRMRQIITLCRDRGDTIHSSFCKRLIAGRQINELKTRELAAYMIAGLCDSDNSTPDGCITECAGLSVGNQAKEYYLIIDPAKQDGYTLLREKHIVFKHTKEIFDKLFSCNERVELRLNDKKLGLIDTFPSRTHLEFIAGQSILYKNSEYEIEHISDDGRTIYLRNENVKLRNCLDTILLRRYAIASLKPIPNRVGVLHNTKLTLEEIRVTENTADFIGETYGFYGLTSDKQTLDFYSDNGLEGNPDVATPHNRYITDGHILKVELNARMECTDGMRLLLAAVCNEFVKTIFPKTYHCVSIVPILADPLPFDSETHPKGETERIKALYPYLRHPGEDMVETNSNRITLLFINDCHEDVGALEWFFDLSGRYMQEFLANIYSYIHWLKIRPNMAHYIYFGGKELPECYDLEGCCKLLEGYNLILSDLGEDEIETAGDDPVADNPERCAFCHKLVESGRFSLFDKSRYICVDCFDIVDDMKRLQELHTEMLTYMHTAYPSVKLGKSKVALDPVYELSADQVLSEYYYRLAASERTIYVESDDPVNNVRVSILRGLIGLWQSDNELINIYSKAQLYFEELLWLRAQGLHESADWIYEALSSEIQTMIKEISDFVGNDVSKNPSDNKPKDQEDNKDAEDNKTEDTIEDTDENPQPEPNEENDSDSDKESGNSRTSFDFMRMKAEGAADDEDEEDDSDDYFFGDDDHSGLYDPNKIPRFWKRYLRNQKLDNGEDEEIPEGEDETEEDSEENTDEPPVDDIPQNHMLIINAPGESTDTTDDSAEDETPKDDPAEDETPKDEPAEDDTTDGKKDKKEKKKKSKKEKKDKDGKKKGGLFKRKTPGEKLVPYEDDEDTNPLIKAYNEIARQAYNYNEEPFVVPTEAIMQIIKIFFFVRCDYPELFWLYSLKVVSHNQIQLIFRCKDPNGKFDVKQVNRKREEIRKGAKEFTRGITRRTDPYNALLTIYRRMILRTDYDTVGLKAGISDDLTRDDPLRSLHSALVNHKIVCAGYAVAMQYLLQSVGIVCGYVISESSADRTCHAFNILKLGKYCYYLDATWGDMSVTDSTSWVQDRINYDYFCVPYDEFLRSTEDYKPYHIPRKEFFGNLEQFNYKNHEYFRYHKAYLKAYNENEIIRIIADTAKAYDKKEMGGFDIGIRFASQTDAQLAYATLKENKTLSRLIEQAAKQLKKKSQSDLLYTNFAIFEPSNAGVIYIRFGLK